MHIKLIALDANMFLIFIMACSLGTAKQKKTKTTEVLDKWNDCKIMLEQMKKKETKKK